MAEVQLAVLRAQRQHWDRLAAVQPAALTAQRQFDSSTASSIGSLKAGWQLYRQHLGKLAAVQPVAVAAKMIVAAVTGVIAR